MQKGIVQTYMTIGAIFGLILAGPLWFVALFDHPVPRNAETIQNLLVTLLIATVHGVARAFAWLPSLVYNVAMHRVPFMHWLLSGWW
jgi:hypothetical protein